MMERPVPSRVDAALDQPLRLADIGVARSARPPGVALVVGERALARCENGALAVEYMLFDPAEVLVASDGVGVREQGYLTTAGLAAARLERAGISVALAEECFAALRPGHLRALARSSAVLDVVDRLTPYEAFEGGWFDAATRRYRGVWLDLDALARCCPTPDAALLFQALHLRVVLEETRRDAAVRMSTAQLAAGRKPNERTWLRTPFDGAARLPNVLAQMRVPARSARNEALDEAEVREELLQSLRSRITAVTAPDHRLHALARRLSSRPRPASTPPGPDLIVTDAQNAVASAPPPIFDELRRHAEMLRGKNHLQPVAKFLAAIAQERSSLPQLAMLAARAWLAAGDKGRACFFALRLVDDPAAPDDVRLAALETLDAAAPTQRPPPPNERAAARVVIPPPPRVPSVPLTQQSPAALPLVTRPPVEIVETLPLAAGLEDSMLGPGDPVVTAVQAHIATTRLARALARDYRLAYGTTLKTDPAAIDAMQQHLRARVGEASPDKELLRHGALLAEIVARSLGAQWEDVGGEPARWVMIVPPSVRVSPIGRVVRYFERGRREADLVAFYFDLETTARGR